MLEDDSDLLKLIEKAINGNNKAFEELMLLQMKVIYNFVCSHLSNQDDITDIIQDITLAIWQSLDKFNFSSSFKTWCISITRHKVADYYRKSYKTTFLPLEDYENQLIAEDEFAKINDKNMAKSIEEILNEREKEIIFLAFNADLSYSEISQITDIPVGTIKSTMSKMKLKVKKHFEKDGVI